MARRRRMTAKQLRYFGKRKKRVYAASVPRKRRYVSMARYRRGRSRSGGRGGFGLGGMKSMLAPIVSGVADSYLDPMLPLDGVGSVLVGGFLLKNNTMKDLGLYKVGFSLGNIIPLPGRGSVSSQGGFI